MDPSLGLAFVIIGLVPAGGLGLIAGWLFGSLLAIFYLRPLLTAEEVRAAIFVDLGSQLMDRRTILRLASLVYGQRIAP